VLVFALTVLKPLLFTTKPGEECESCGVTVRIHTSNGDDCLAKTIALNYQNMLHLVLFLEDLFMLPDRT